MVPGLTGGKMSSSEPDSKIDLLDSPEDVRRKIKKAFCEPGNVQENGVLAFAKHVLFPVLDGKEFVVRRTEKHGGDVHYSAYPQLEEAYAGREIFPLDLKNAVARELSKLLEPIQTKFAADAEMQLVRDKGYPDEVKKKGGARKSEPERAVDVSRLDLRVGVVVSAEKHPDSSVSSLYVEKIDIGEKEPRTVVSGLAKYLTLDELRGRKVVLLCNLKPANMKGVKSEAMLLAASKDERVEPLDPPASSGPSDRVYVDGYQHDLAGEPDAVLNPKRKIFEQVQADLGVNSECVAEYKGEPLRTAGGVVRVRTLTSAGIK
jgi:tyrosyl-tRNA synthetase